MKKVELTKKFCKQNYQTGASDFKIICWYLISLVFFRTGIIPFSNVLVFVLRCFGATIGIGVRIKPSIHIKYPWKLSIGDYSWLADCYIENLDPVIIGKNVCLSQQCMIINGNHDYKSVTFNLITKPVVIEDGSWIAARAIIGPGVLVGTHSILSMGSVITQNMQAYTIYKGNPAKIIRKRIIK